MVQRLLTEHRVPASLLRLEVTESAVMGDAARCMEVLQRLHDLGVRLSIDDFGTGYSSMAYLRRLPVDELKIDRSFVLGMCTTQQDAVLVRTAIDLGHNLGLTVVAEGVEGAEHVDALRVLGCDLAQGYHFARPMLAAELTDAARRGRHDPRRRRHGGHHALTPTDPPRTTKPRPTRTWASSRAVRERRHDRSPGSL